MAPFASSQASVPGSNVIFNYACKLNNFNCRTPRNTCDLALVKVPAANVPAKAQTAALPLYRWDDEVGKNIDMYGFDKTGRADKLMAVSALTSCLRIGKSLACTRTYNSSRISLCHRMDIYIYIICSQKQEQKKQ